MKHVTSAILLLFILSGTASAQKSFESDEDSGLKKSVTEAVTKDIEITYNSSDVCGLPCLGTVQVVEKRFWYHNSPLKEKTMVELQQLAADMGGNIVFVDIKQTSGWGLIFSSTYEGFVYKKTE